jgi:hypothetical protein
MQRLPILLAILSIGLPTLSHGLTIETAYTRQYAADEIRTIGNHLGEPLANQGFRTVVASQPKKPGGQYFILHLQDKESATPAVARMTLFTTDRKDSVEHSWNIPAGDLDSWLYLGLTGSDWADSDVRPLAWRIELLDSSGAVLAEWKSFLWEMP